MQKISVKQTINTVLENFDFEKVHKTMRFLDWRCYEGSGVYEVPTQDKLIQVARNLLTEAALNVKDKYTVGTIGLQASAEVYPDGELILSLEFILESFHYSSQNTCY